MKRENAFPFTFFRSPHRCTCDRDILNVYSKFVLKRTYSFSNIFYIKLHCSYQKCMLLFYSKCLKLKGRKTLEQMLNWPLTTCCLLQ